MTTEVSERIASALPAVEERALKAAFPIVHVTALHQESTSFIAAHEAAKLIKVTRP